MKRWRRLRKLWRLFWPPLSPEERMTSTLRRAAAKRARARAKRIEGYSQRWPSCGPVERAKVRRIA